MQTTTAGAAGLVLAVLLFAGCNDGITPNPTAPTRPALAQYTLSGVVFETIAYENRPRAGVRVQCEECEWSNGRVPEMRTDSSGVYFFTFTGPGTGVMALYVGLDEYRVVGATYEFADGSWVEIPLNGNTRRDIEVARR